MANEINTTPRISLHKGSVNKAVGIAYQSIDQTGSGSAAESGRVPNATPVTITTIAGMTKVGVAHIANLSAVDSGDDNLTILADGAPALLMLLGEQFSMRLLPGVVYAVAATATTGCDWSITIFED